MNILNVLIIYLGTTSAIILALIGLLAFACCDIKDFKHEVKRLVPRIFVLTLFLYFATASLVKTVVYFTGLTNGN